MRNSRWLLISLLAACAGGAKDGAPGGNVGFGGAQDIGEFRGILDRGDIPAPNTLDANGFFNEHFNAPPANAQCQNTLCLTPGLAVGRDFVTGAHQILLQIAVSTSVDPATLPRLPMNLVVVVDRSGSMQQDGRLDKVKLGLHTLITNLNPEDRLALLSFDDVVDQEASFAATRDQLHGAVDRLTPRGGTNIFDGLEAGFKLLGDFPDRERQNRVIFLSDGLATVGNTVQSSIISMATQYIQRGIGLTTIGVGNDFDVELMRGLAERGAGNFYYVEDATAANEVFTEELDFFMQPLAMDVRIEAATAPGWTMGHTAGSRLWADGARQGTMQIPAVFFASRTSQGGELGRRGGGSMIFIELTPETRNAGAIADLTLTYRLPDTQEEITQRIPVSYERDPLEDLAEPHLSYAELAERYAMYNVYRGLVAATEAAQYDYSCALSILLATRAATIDWNRSHLDPDLEADIALMDQFIANLREKGGGATEVALGSCPSADDPWSSDGDYYEGHGHYACSAGGATGWLSMIGALGLVIRRRRAR